MSVMDGNLYDTRFQEAGQELDDDLEAALLLLNNRQQPLLAPGGGGQHSSAGQVLVQLSVCPSAPVCLSRAWSRPASAAALMWACDLMPASTAPDSARV